jgi:hypothetical protein
MHAEDAEDAALARAMEMEGEGEVEDLLPPVYRAEWRDRATTASVVGVVGVGVGVGGATSAPSATSPRPSVEVVGPSAEGRKW